ncbi:MAG: VWA domain-containing protein [Oscillospiraceae bacterium]|nr:VWA domain-containing protein [Oscillospiraceae bacterium]
MREQIIQVLHKIKESFGTDVFANPRLFSAVLADVKIETDAKKIRNLLNIAVRDIHIYQRLEKGLASNNKFIIDNLICEISSDYMIEKTASQAVVEAFADLLGYISPPVATARKVVVNPLEGLIPTRPVLIVFFVIDKSGNMAGAGINALNHAMREMIPILKNIDGQGADLKVAVLTFSAGAEWLYSEPQDVEDFEWYDIETNLDYDWDNYTSDFGAACDELYVKMSREAYMSSRKGYKIPIIILITAGKPTDNWQPSLAKLKKNRWFKAAFKIGLAVDDANENVIGEFVGTKKGKNGKYERVYQPYDANKLKKLFRGEYSSYVCSHEDEDWD